MVLLQERAPQHLPCRQGPARACALLHESRGGSFEDLNPRIAASETYQVVWIRAGVERLEIRDWRTRSFSGEAFVRDVCEPFGDARDDRVADTDAVAVSAQPRERDEIACELRHRGPLERSVIVEVHPV